jgi:hypothetical protein
MAVLLDDIEVFPPSSIDPVPFYIELEERTASGKMAVEITAEKRRVSFSWELISFDDLKGILDALSTGVFHRWTYPDPRGGEAHTIVAKLDGAPSIKNFRVVGGVRYWKNVSMSIVER